jgi:6-phosphogluconate dehydrogenase
MSNNLFDFGMIGLGVMGRNLLLNVADHGFSVIGFDKDEAKTTALETAATAGTTVKGVPDLEEMVQNLKTPRKLMMLVPAGQPVDDVIASLLPLLEVGDVVIDGGNSHYTDTLRRVEYLKETGINFMGMGVSGGEQGARTGPSMMPGGNVEAYAHIKPILESIAAKVGGVPCVDYLGKGGAGHYVKMVHNGIEYAIMQLISESYAILKKGGLSNEKLHETFKTWNEGLMQSFLVEITADIFLQKDDKTDAHLVDVAMRTLSGYKDERVQAATLYADTDSTENLSEEELISKVHDALYFATILSYAQGLAMLFQASKDLQMDIPLPKVVSVWRGGCIIRSLLLEVFSKAYAKNGELSNILLNEDVAAVVKSVVGNTREVVALAAKGGVPAGALMSSLAYFDAFRSERMPTNLIQAQRDYFGAHTYQRTDMPGTFHTEWGQN